MGGFPLYPLAMLHPWSTVAELKRHEVAYFEGVGCSEKARVAHAARSAASVKGMFHDSTMNAAPTMLPGLAPSRLVRRAYAQSEAVPALRGIR